MGYRISLFLGPASVFSFDAALLVFVQSSAFLNGAEFLRTSQLIGF